ncbi:MULTISPECIES: hypothetical protein [unclassified Nostoc]|uniref:hypothetical protein n=1 Tax=unclassified Nostoc TaxID=2593658 RepID=UPI002FF5339A
MHLTEAGEVFLERSYLVLAQLEQAIKVTQRIGRGEVGRLVIGFVFFNLARKRTQWESNRDDT